MTDAPSEDWTLVTVTYNSELQLESCWGAAAIGHARWVVVDNASEDDSVDVARQLGAEVIQLPRNIGFSAANNIGLASVASPWVAFLNPDVTIADAANLGRLARVAAANDALVAPQLLNPDGTEQPNARGLPFVADKVANRVGRFPGSRLEEYVRSGLTTPTYCAWVIGAAVAGRADLFRELGGWDERYFVYYEDHALGLRSWQAGHPVVLDPGVRWSHEWQRATTRLHVTPWRHELRSATRFYAKHPHLVHRSKKRVPLICVTRQLWTPAVGPD